MPRPFAPAVLLAAGWSIFAHAASPVVTLAFDDVSIAGEHAPYSAPLPAVYGGLTWNGGAGLQVADADAYAFLFPFAPSSGSQAVFNGAVPADVEVRRSPCGRFDVMGARFRTWGGAPTGTVSFSGWADETKRYQAGPFVIDRVFRPIRLRWKAIDRLVIQAPVLYLMDDFRFALDGPAHPCAASAETAMP